MLMYATEFQIYDEDGNHLATIDGEDEENMTLKLEAPATEPDELEEMAELFRIALAKYNEVIKTGEKE